MRFHGEFLRNQREIWSKSHNGKASNNRSLNQEKRSNQRYYGGEPGNVEELWVFPDTDFARLAQDMGGFGIRVHHPGEIQGALDKAVASGKPAVVDVVSDINGIAPRAWTPS